MKKKCTNPIGHVMRTRILDDGPLTACKFCGATGVKPKRIKTVILKDIKDLKPCNSAVGHKWKVYKKKNTDHYKCEYCPTDIELKKGADLPPTLAPEA